MAKTFFSSGDIVTADWLNAINSPKFDDLDLDGHYPRIGNDALQKGQGSLWADTYGFLNELKVSLSNTPSSGQSALLQVAEGWVVDPDGMGSGEALLRYVPRSTIAIQNNQTSYIWATRLGTISSGSALPTTDAYLPLARAVMAGGAVGELEDLRTRLRQPLIAPKQPKVQNTRLSQWLSPTGGAYSITLKIRAMVGSDAEIGFLWSGLMALLIDTSSEPTDISLWAQDILSKIQSQLTLDEILVMSGLIL